MVRKENGNPVIAGIEIERRINVTSILMFFLFIFSMGGIYADLTTDVQILDQRTTTLQAKYEAQEQRVIQQDKDIALILERINETQSDIRELKRLLEKHTDQK